MLRTAARRVRPGFTLVELLVAAAVCVLIMAILAGAFSMGIDTMRQMKGTGDMMDQLRGAGVVLKDDLRAKHFLTSDGGKKLLSDFRWDQVKVKDNGTGASPQYVLEGWEAPAHGFFRVRSTPLTGTRADADGLINGTGNATDHYLHFTSILEAATDDDYFRATGLDASAPPVGRAYHSTAAEIAYFLEGPIGTTPGVSNLYRLIRRQRLVAVNDTDRRDRPWPNMDATSGARNQSVFSLRPSGNPPFTLNTLADLTDPRNRLDQHADPLISVPLNKESDTKLAPMATRVGEDTVLSNVLSFEVQVAYAGSGSPSYTPGVPPVIRTGVPSMNLYPRDFDTQKGNETTEFPFDTLPLPTSSKNKRYSDVTVPSNKVLHHTYDSWSPVFDRNWTTDINQSTGQLNSSDFVPPLLIRVQAVQIRIRVWDAKTQNARQLTFVQDL